jgi:hypothetical protein
VPLELPDAPSRLSPGTAATEHQQGNEELSQACHRRHSRQRLQRAVADPP